VRFPEINPTALDCTHAVATRYGPICSFFKDQRTRADVQFGAPRTAVERPRPEERDSIGLSAHSLWVEGASSSNGLLPNANCVAATSAQRRHSPCWVSLRIAASSVHRASFITEAEFIPACSASTCLGAPELVARFI
jgi:hypothetical protein